MDIVHLLHKYGVVHRTDYKETIEIQVTINEIISQKIIGNLYQNPKL